MAQLDLANVEAAFAEIGVSIKDVKGDFRTLYDIMEDASSKLGYLSEEAKETFYKINGEVFK